MEIKKAIDHLLCMRSKQDSLLDVEAIDIALKALMCIKSIQFNCYALNKLMENFDNE